MNDREGQKYQNGTIVGFFSPIELSFQSLESAVIGGEAIFAYLFWVSPTLRVAYHLSDDPCQEIPDEVRLSRPMKGKNSRPLRDAALTPI